MTHSPTKHSWQSTATNLSKSRRRSSMKRLLGEHWFHLGERDERKSFPRRRIYTMRKRSLTVNRRTPETNPPGWKMLPKYTRGPLIPEHHPRLMLSTLVMFYKLLGSHAIWNYARARRKRMFPWNKRTIGGSWSRAS